MGFRVLFGLAVVCIAIGLITVYVPGCQPEDIVECTTDAGGHQECTYK